MRRAILAGGVAFAALGAARDARAYPHFQLSSETAQCAQCHLSPAGGGLLTEWGQGELGDTIAPAGDGRFLHGLVELPAWLSLGGDIRLAALANDVGADEGVELAAFPMQADLAAHVRFGAWSVGATFGARGVVRSGASSTPDSPASEVDGPSLASYVVSREHYVMWRSEAGPYARAGRFAAPYGLRLADHTAYVRRYLGYNLLEETYGVGGGWIGNSWEAHATAFVYDPLQGATREEFGGAATVEAQLGPSAVVGISARGGIARDDTRLQAGLHGRVWIAPARVLLQGEVDGVRQLFDAGAGDRWQLASYVGPVFIPVRGLYTGLAYEAFAEDLQVRAVTRHAGNAWVSYLPYAHVELMLSARAQLVGPEERAYLGLLQLHYML